MQNAGRSILRQVARSPAAQQTQQQTARLSSASGGCFNISKDGNVAILTLDVPGEKVNTMSTRMIAEFGAVLDTIASDESVKSAVVISGKADNFIAGADITELAQHVFRCGVGSCKRAGLGSAACSRTGLHRAPTAALLTAQLPCFCGPP